jgi:hypothetical protein
MLSAAGLSSVPKNCLVTDTGVFLKTDISLTTSGETTFIDVAIAQAAASTHVNRAASVDDAACAAARRTG